MKTSTNNAIKTIVATEQSTGEAAKFGLLVRTKNGVTLHSGPLVPTTPPEPPESVVTTVTLAPDALTAKVGQSILMTYTVRDQDGQPMADVVPTFVSSDPTVATFDGTVVHALKAGNATVSVVCDGKSDQASVSVADAVVVPPASTLTLAKFLGPLFTYTKVMTLGGALKTWAQRWADPTYTGAYRMLEATRWAAVGAKWDFANYYDRAAINYAFSIITGDATLLQHAHALAIDYRTWVLSSLKDGGPAAYWMMPDGIAAHFLAAGDTESKRTVGVMADIFCGLTYRNSLPQPQCDNRLQAYYLRTVLDAWAINAPSSGVGAPLGLPGGKVWADELRFAQNAIMNGRGPDGVWYAKLALNDPIVPDRTPIVHPFTLGLLMDAEARYYDLFEQDSRIVPTLKACCDHLWTLWMPTPQCFPYLPADTTDDGSPAKGRGPAPDLNMLIARGFSFVYRITRDQTYYDRALQITAGHVAGAWLSPDKQINEGYSSGFRAEGDLVG